MTKKLIAHQYKYFAEYDDRIDIHRICSSPEWQALIKRCVLSRAT